MSKKKLRIVHFLNQFFGQIGGEEQANVGLSVKEGPVGPGMLLQKLMGEDGTVVATIICGDNHFAANLQQASEEALKLIEPFKPDVFFAGPAFAAGRYGLNCGEMCKRVGVKLQIPTFTSMFNENPGADIYRKDCYIVETGNSAAKMGQAVGGMVNLAKKVAFHEHNPHNVILEDQFATPDESGYFARGILRNERSDKTAACRGVDMLLAKIKGEPFQSEVVLPKYEEIPPPPAVKDMKTCEIAIVSDSGLCPGGNPNGLSGRGNKVWCTYEVADLFPEKGPFPEYYVAHTGYYPRDVLENTNRILPYDILRELEHQGVIGKVHHSYFCTSGNITPTMVCHDMGEEMAQEIKKRQIGAVILTST